MNVQILSAVILTAIFFTSCADTKQPQPEEAALEYKIRAELGEGAFWNHETNELYWVDIEGKKLHIYNPETKTNRSFDTPSRIGTVVPADSTTAVIALEDGIYLMNTTNGETELLSDVESEITENRFNDGKAGPGGQLWVGSMHLPQNEPKARLYMVEGDGTATPKVENVTISNGIVWSGDERTMYYIDTPTQKIRAYDYDPASGAITNERVAVEVPDSLGYPDGMCIDEQDKLWVGMWNGNAVARFDPVTGSFMSKIEVPAHNVTSCAFGGPNLEIMYITTASLDMTEEERQKYPLAGSLFKARAGVKGVKSYFFKLSE